MSNSTEAILERIAAAVERNDAETIEQVIEEFYRLIAVFSDNIRSAFDDNIRSALDNKVGDIAFETENIHLQAALDKAHAQLTETTGLLEDANCELESMFAELPSIVEQLRSCVYTCEAGPLTGNVAFVRLEQLAHPSV